jgi:hypothetical protein
MLQVIIVVRKSHIRIKALHLAEVIMELNLKLLQSRLLYGSQFAGAMMATSIGEKSLELESSCSRVLAR